MLRDSRLMWSRGYSEETLGAPEGLLQRDEIVKKNQIYGFFAMVKIFISQREDTHTDVTYNYIFKNFFPFPETRPLKL